MNALPKSNPVNFQVIDDGFGSSDDGGENYQYYEEAVWQKLQIDETIPDLSPMFEKFPNLSPDMPLIGDHTSPNSPINHFYLTDDEYILENINPSLNQDGTINNNRTRNNNSELPNSLGIGSLSNNFGNNISSEPIECVVVNVAHLEQFPKAVSKYSANLPCIFSWFDAHNAFSSEFPTTVQNYFKLAYNSIKQHIRFFFSIAPSQERLNNLSSVRREVPSGRILFHYIGYGFPNIGKKNIWCSERRSREFVPFKLETLFERLHPPTWFIFDCNNAAVVIKEFKETADRLNNSTNITKQQQQQIPHTSFPQNSANEIYSNNNDSGIDWNDWFCLCASSADEELPDDPRLPRDFLTSTFLTPIKMAAICHMLQYYRLNLVNSTFPLDPPCSHLWNEKSPESTKLTHALTAITDGIASDSLSPELYSKLFRGDVLASSLYRNFLLAQYLLRPYRVHPVSYPEIPDLSMHPMWRQWSILLDTAICAVSIPKPAFTVDLFTRAATTFEVLMKNEQFDLIRPYHLSLLYHSLLNDPTNDQPILLLSEYARNKHSSPEMLVLSTIFPPLFTHLMKTDSSQPVFYHLCFLIIYLLYYNPTFANEIPKEVDASHFPSIAFNRKLHDKTRIIAAALVAILVVSHEKFQQICTSNDYLDKVREELAFSNTRPNLSVWLMLSIRRAFNLYSPDPAVFTENALHLQCAICTCSESQAERAAAISVLTCFLRPFECKCNSQILFMSVFSAIKDASFIVRFHLVLLLKKFVMSFDSFSEAVNSITSLSFDNYHTLINSIYNCTISCIHPIEQNENDNENQNANEDNKSKDDDKKTSDDIVDIKNNISVFEKIDKLMHDEKVSDKAYAVAIALLQMLSNDPHPSVSSLSHTVLQFVSKQRNAFEYSMNEYGAAGSDDLNASGNTSTDSVGMFLNPSASQLNTDQSIVSYGDDEFEAEHLSFANLDQNESLHHAMLRNLINPYSAEQSLEKNHTSKSSFFALLTHPLPISSLNLTSNRFLKTDVTSEAPIKFIDFDVESSSFAAATDNSIFFLNMGNDKDMFRFDLSDTSVVSLSISSMPFKTNVIDDISSNKSGSEDDKISKGNNAFHFSLSPYSQSKALIKHTFRTIMTRKVVIIFATGNGCVYLWCPPKKTPSIVFRADPHIECCGKLFSFFCYNNKHQMQENEHKTHHKEIESESSCSNIDNLCDSFCVTITNSGIISSWCLGIQEILSEYSTNMKIKSAFSHKDKECSRDFSVILSNDTNECFLFESKRDEQSIQPLPDIKNNDCGIFKVILCNNDIFIAYDDGSIIKRKRQIEKNNEIKKLIEINDSLLDFSVSEDGSIIVVCPTNKKPRVYFSNSDDNYDCMEIAEIEKGVSCITHKSRNEICFIIGNEKGSVFLFSQNYYRKK